MGLSKKGRYVYCYECGSRGEMNGVCKNCGHIDNPPLAGMVPIFASLTQSEAIALLTGPEAQLVVGNVTTENSETFPIDTIISSDPPEEQQLEIGAAVDLIVSLGPST